MEAAEEICGRHLKVVRREESLRSRQHRGVCVRVVCEGESLEVLRTEIEPGSSLEKGEVGNFSVMHFVIEGSPVVSTASESSDLMPGDSVALGAGEDYTIHNRAFSRAVLLSLILKHSEEPKGKGEKSPAPQSIGRGAQPTR